MSHAPNERNPDKRVVRIFRGEGAGTIRVCDPDEAHRLCVVENRAQDLKDTDGRDLLEVEVGPDPARGDYATRELRAADNGRARRGRTRH